MELGGAERFQGEADIYPVKQTPRGEASRYMRGRITGTSKVYDTRSSHLAGRCQAIRAVPRLAVNVQYCGDATYMVCRSDRSSSMLFRGYPFSCSTLRFLPGQAV